MLMRGSRQAARTPRASPPQTEGAPKAGTRGRQRAPRSQKVGLVFFFSFFLLPVCGELNREGLCWGGCGARGTLYAASRNVNWCSPLENNLASYPTPISLNPAIPLPAYSPETVQGSIRRDHRSAPGSTTCKGLNLGITKWSLTWGVRVSTCVPHKEPSQGTAE